MQMMRNVPMHGLVFYDKAKKYLGPDRRKSRRRDGVDTDEQESMEIDRRTGRERRMVANG